MTNNYKSFLHLVVLIVLIASLLIYRPASAGLWWQSFLDWSHVPVFAGITATIWWLLPNRLHPIQRLAITGLAAVAIAVLTELVQSRLGRSAELSDVASDVTGSIVALTAISALRNPSPVNHILAIASLSLFAWSMVPLGSVSWHMVERSRIFPVLFKGGNHDSPLISAQDSILSVGCDSESGRKYTQIELLSSQRPGIRIHDFSGVWWSFDVLRIDIQVLGSEEISLKVRIYDYTSGTYGRVYQQRYIETFPLAPGMQTLEIPVASIFSSTIGSQDSKPLIDSLFLESTKEYAGRELRLFEIALN